MVEQGMPAYVVSPLFFPYNGTRVLLEPLSDRFQFPEVMATPHLLTEEGRVVAARVDGVALGDATTCLAEVRQGGTSRVDLPGELWAWDWYVTVSYRTDDTSYLVTTFGEAEVGAPLLPGSGSLTFKMVAEGGAVNFGVLSGNVCVTELRIGVPYENATGG